MQQWAEMGLAFYRKIFAGESAFLYEFEFSEYLQLETKKPSQLEFWNYDPILRKITLKNGE